MTRADVPAFATGMAALGEAFGESVSELRALTYFDALSDLAIEDVLAAMRGLVRSSQFFPRPVAIREAVHGNPADLTETAWLVWRRAAQDLGAYASIVLADPALAHTLLAMFGSWANACSAEFSDEMWTAKRKEFDRVYHVFAHRALTGSRYLTGILEEKNNGLTPFTPIGYLEGMSVRELRGDERQRLVAASARAPEPAPVPLIDAGREAS